MGPEGCVHKATSWRQTSTKRRYACISELFRGKRRDSGLITALIQGMVEAAAGHAMRRDNKVAVKRELRRAVERIVET
jgi:hypothetical protein